MSTKDNPSSRAALCREEWPDLFQRSLSPSGGTRWRVACSDAQRFNAVWLQYFAGTASEPRFTFFVSFFTFCRLSLSFVDCVTQSCVYSGLSLLVSRCGAAAQVQPFFFWDKFSSHSCPQPFQPTRNAWITFPRKLPFSGGAERPDAQFPAQPHERSGSAESRLGLPVRRHSHAS